MKKLLVLSISLITVFTIIVVMFKQKEGSKTTSSNIPSSINPYPTGIFPEDFIWRSNKCLYYYLDNGLFEYCIDKDINRISEIQNLYQDFFQRRVRLGKEIICDTYNFTITDYEQIATKIAIYNSTDLTLKVIFESNLTLQVDVCEDPLILSNALPVLEKKQYIWDHSETIPIETEELINRIEIRNEHNLTILSSQKEKLLSFKSVATFIEAKSNEDKSKYGLIDYYIGEFLLCQQIHDSSSNRTGRAFNWTTRMDWELDNPVVQGYYHG